MPKQKENKRTWLCREGTEDFTIQAETRADAEAHAEMYNAVVLKEIKNKPTTQDRALRAAGALVTYFTKKGDVSGHFSPKEMAVIIEREYARKS